MIMISQKKNAKKVFRKLHDNVSISLANIDQGLRRAIVRLDYDDRECELNLTTKEVHKLANLFEMAYVQLKKGGKDDSGSEEV